MSPNSITFVGLENLKRKYLSFDIFMSKVCTPDIKILFWEKCRDFSKHPTGQLLVGPMIKYGSGSGLGQWCPKYM